MSLRLIRNATMEDVRRELSHMLGEGIVSPAVRQVAEIASRPGQDRISSVFDFVRGTFPYTPDPIDMELFVSPNRMALAYLSGRIRGDDCDGLALMSGAMLGSLGYPVRIALLDSSGAGEIDHAVAQVQTEMGWINVDTASRLPLGWIYPRIMEIIEPQ